MYINFRKNRVVAVLIFLMAGMLCSCSYKHRVEKICQKHGVIKLPDPQCTVEFYYGNKKMKDLFELKAKIDSADIADKRRTVLDTLAVDVKGRVVYGGPKPRAVRPIMRIRLEIPKNALFEDLQRMRGYKGFRIVHSVNNFSLFESSGHEYYNLSSICDGHSNIYYSRIAVQDNRQFIDYEILFSQTFNEEDFFSMEVEYWYLKGDDGNKVSLLELGEGKFVFKDTMVK